MGTSIFLPTGNVMDIWTVLTQRTRPLAVVNATVLTKSNAYPKLGYAISGLIVLIGLMKKTVRVMDQTIFCARMDSVPIAAWCATVWITVWTRVMKSIVIQLSGVASRVFWHQKKNLSCESCPNRPQKSRRKVKVGRSNGEEPGH
ncbi:unnamed protein product, partial [Allacma fusca]